MSPQTNAACKPMSMPNANSRKRFEGGLRLPFRRSGSAVPTAQLASELVSSNIIKPQQSETENVTEKSLLQNEQSIEIEQKIEEQEGCKLYTRIPHSGDEIQNEHHGVLKTHQSLSKVTMAVFDSQKGIVGNTSVHSATVTPLRQSEDNEQRDNNLYEHVTDDLECLQAIQASGHVVRSSRRETVSRCDCRLDCQDKFNEQRKPVIEEGTGGDVHNKPSYDVVQNEQLHQGNETVLCAKGDIKQHRLVDSPYDERLKSYREHDKDMLLEVNGKKELTTNNPKQHPVDHLRLRKSDDYSFFNNFFETKTAVQNNYINMRDSQELPDPSALKVLMEEENNTFDTKSSFQELIESVESDDEVDDDGYILIIGSMTDHLQTNDNINDQFSSKLTSFKSESNMPATILSNPNQGIEEFDLCIDDVNDNFSENQLARNRHTSSKETTMSRIDETWMEDYNESDTETAIATIAEAGKQQGQCRIQTLLLKY